MINSLNIKIDELKIIKIVTVKSLRDFILDNALIENDTLLINTNNIDDITLEFRDTYGESIKHPYFLLGVLIEEDTSGKVKKGHIGIIRDDARQESIR